MLKKIIGDKKLLADLILVLSLLLIALSVFLVLKFTGESGEIVKVFVDGEFACEYSLVKDGEYALNGGTNILVIKDGEAFVKLADCPRQVCVNSRPISRVGQKIECLHNRVLIRVYGADEELIGG